MQLHHLWMQHASSYEFRRMCVLHKLLVDVLTLLCSLLPFSAVTCLV
jgi:hypothetical protein